MIDLNEQIYYPSFRTHWSNFLKSTLNKLDPAEQSLSDDRTRFQTFAKSDRFLWSDSSHLPSISEVRMDGALQTE